MCKHICTPILVVGQGNGQFRTFTWGFHGVYVGQTTIISRDTSGTSVAFSNFVYCLVQS